MDLPQAFVRHQSRIRAEMLAVLEGRDLPLYDMVRYALGWQEADGSARETGGGKGMRPSLALLTAEALAGEREEEVEAARRRAVGGAAAVEFVHAFSLVHDDIQDEDRERHHRDTVWVVWGRAQAINTGDALRELAERALFRALDAGVPAETVLAAHGRLNAAAQDMIEGQYLDLSYEERPAVTVDEYLTMVERKTGAMIGCAMAMGALLGSGDADTAAALDRAGRRLGLCFQIRDDWLGIWGDSGATGKSSESDIRRRKKSYPIVHALEHAPPSQRGELAALYAQPELSQADVDAVLGMLAAADAQAATEHAAQAHHAAFESELAGLGLSATARASLAEVSDFILRRAF